MRATIVAAAMLASGCASITSGGKQMVTVASSPTGANVRLNGLDVGVTPATVQLSRNDKVTVINLSKDGYKPQDLNPGRTVDPWFFGNIILGGLIGSTTDVATNNINKFDRDSYLVTLEPADGPPVLMGKIYTNAGDMARAREFILVSYSSLAEEIARGSGAYLNSLYSLLSVAPANQRSALDQLRALTVVYPNIVDFADHVIQVLGPKAQ